MKKLLILLSLVSLVALAGCDITKDDDSDSDVPQFEIEEDQMLDLVTGGWVVVTDNSDSDSGGDTGENEGTLDYEDFQDMDYSDMSAEEIEQMVEDYREQVLEEEDTGEEDTEDTEDTDMDEDDSDDNGDQDQEKPSPGDRDKDEEDEKDEKTVVWEGYLYGEIEGQPSFEHDVYLSNVSAHLEGPIYVYDDYSVSGEVDVVYDSWGNCVTVEPGSSCSLTYTTDGIYNVTGMVVQYDRVDWVDKSEDWPFPDNYWLQVFFTRKTPASETMLFVAPYYSATVTDNGLESILYGPFTFPQMFYPGFNIDSFNGEIDTQSFEVSNRWGVGEVSISLLDPDGWADYQSVREMIN